MLTYPNTASEWYVELSVSHNSSTVPVQLLADCNDKLVLVLMITDKDVEVYDMLDSA